MAKGKTYKLYMPKWMFWFSLIVIVPIALLGVYESFVVEKNANAGIVIAFIMAAVIVMTYLVSHKKLPYMIMEENK